MEIRNKKRIEISNTAFYKIGVMLLVKNIA